MLGDGAPYSSGLLQAADYNRRLLLTELPEGKKMLVISASQLGESAVHFYVLSEAKQEGCWKEVYNSLGVCLRCPPAVGTKAGNRHPRQEAGKAVSAQVSCWRDS
jgi:hypothetical protein